MTAYRSEDRASSKLFQLPEGEHTEGMHVIHIDSHQPENLKVIEDHPEGTALFPNGLKVLGPDTEGQAEGDDLRFNFATTFEFKNRKWKTCAVAELNEGGDEVLNPGSGGIYRVVVSEWKDRSHERDAKPSDHVDFWGPADV